MQSNKELWRQYVVAIIANLYMVVAGTAFVYSSPAGPMLLSGDFSLQITEAQNSWFTSLLNMGSIFGAMITHVLLQKMGRRRTILMCGVPLLLGYILLAAAQNFAMLAIGRLWHGLAVGILFVAVPPYVGEISDVSIRGRLGAILSVAIMAGTILIYAPASSIGDFRWIAASIIPLPVIFTVLAYFFVCESPVYLVDQNKEEEATKVLKKLNGSQCSTEPLLDSIKVLAENYSSKNRLFDLKSFRSREVYRPFILIIFMQFCQQFGGLNVILFNTYSIFQRSGVDISNDLAFCVFSILGVAASLLSSYLMDKMGRKFLIIFSYTGAATGLTCLGIFFHFVNDESMKDWMYAKLWWLPVVSVLGYGFFYFLCASFIGFALAAEYFPPNVRMFCSSVISVLTWIFAFIVTLTYAETRDALGDDGVYWLYASICLACVVFTIFFIPETKGKTFIEITSYFKTGKFSSEIQGSTESPMVAK